MGYLGNVLALVPDYREFDAIIAHGDSLLLPLTGKPVVRVMHGSALGEARSAASIGRRVLQLGVTCRNSPPRSCSAGVVGVSENTRRDNPFVRRVIPHGVDDRFFSEAASARARSPRCCSSARSTGASAGGSCSTGSCRTVRAAHPDATLDFVGPPGPRLPGVTYHTGITDDGAGRPVPPRVGVRLAEHLRGVRPAVSRGDGVRHAGGGVAESRQRRGAR